MRPRAPTERQRPTRVTHGGSGLPLCIASCRAVAATALGLVLSLSLVGCAQEAASPTWVGCSLGQMHGRLVAENGRPVVRYLVPDQPDSDPVPLDWPDGWEIREIDGDQFEVKDGPFSVRVTTPARVIMYDDGNYDTPARNRDGEFVVCDMHRYEGPPP